MLFEPEKHTERKTKGFTTFVGSLDVSSKEHGEDKTTLLCEWPIESIGKCFFFCTRI